MGTFASKATHTRFNAASQPTSNIFTKRIALPESKRKREGEKTHREREREREMRSILTSSLRDLFSDSKKLKNRRRVYIHRSKQKWGEQQDHPWPLHVYSQHPNLACAKCLPTKCLQCTPHPKLHFARYTKIYANNILLRTIIQATLISTSLYYSHQLHFRTVVSLLRTKLKFKAS